MPKVSVIVPIYGVEKFIERCARSLFEQTLDGIEFIFVDDCTPDGSMEILGRLIDEYRPRFAGMNWAVRTERMPTNSGLPAVRRHGIQLATGDYIAHCDSDDWVDMDMYRSMYEKAVEEDADAVVCDYLVTDGQGNDRQVKACHSTDRDCFIKNQLFQRDSWSLCNKLFRRTAYYKGIVFPKGNMGEDMALCSQLILHCTRLSYVAKPLYFYFSNPDSITKRLTTETIMHNFKAVKENTDIVLSVYSHLAEWKEHTGLLYIQYNAKTHLFPLVHRKEYRKLFVDTYSGLFWKMLLRVGFPWQCKLKYAIAYLWLYPRKINV